MGFWIFMLVMTLLIPLTMFAFGTIFIKKPPKNINAFYGYRTSMSMKNMDTWMFAHQHAGRIWLLTGIVTTIPSVIVMALVFHKEIDTIGWTGGIIVLLQCAVMCLPLVFTERALKQNFDEYGMKR